MIYCLIIGPVHWSASRPKVNSSLTSLQSSAMLCRWGILLNWSLSLPPQVVEEVSGLSGLPQDSVRCVRLLLQTKALHSPSEMYWRPSTVEQSGVRESVVLRRRGKGRERNE